MLYSYTYFLENKLDMNQLTQYDTWLRLLMSALVIGDMMVEVICNRMRSVQTPNWFCVGCSSVFSNLSSVHMVRAKAVVSVASGSFITSTCREMLSNCVIRLFLIFIMLPEPLCPTMETYSPLLISILIPLKRFSFIK